MIVGLQVLLALVRRFEYKRVGARGDLERITIAAMPLLLQFFTLCTAQDTPEAARAVHLIAKIYFTAFQHDISPDMQAGLEAWIPALLALVAKEVPPQREDSETDPWIRARAPWWKAKKWTYHVLVRLFSRCAAGFAPWLFSMFSSSFFFSFQGTATRTCAPTSIAALQSTFSRPPRR